MQNEAGEYVDMYIPRYVKLRAVQCDPMCGVQEVFRLQPDPVRQGPRQHPDQPRRRGRVDREDDGMSGPVSKCRLNFICIPTLLLWRGNCRARSRRTPSAGRSGGWARATTASTGWPRRTESWTRSFDLSSFVPGLSVPDLLSVNKGDNPPLTFCPLNHGSSEICYI